MQEMIIGFQGVLCKKRMLRYIVKESLPNTSMGLNDRGETTLLPTQETVSADPRRRVDQFEFEYLVALISRGAKTDFDSLIPQQSDKSVKG